MVDTSGTSPRSTPSVTRRRSNPPLPSSSNSKAGSPAAHDRIRCERDSYSHLLLKQFFLIRKFENSDSRQVSVRHQESSVDCQPNFLPSLPGQDSHQLPYERSPTPRRDDMAAGFQRMSGDARRYPSSSSNAYRVENRPPMSNVLCRNGPQCRKFQEGRTMSPPSKASSEDLQLAGTCNYNHDFSSMPSNGLSVLVVPVFFG